jgi:hypothetical protein
MRWLVALSFLTPACVFAGDEAQAAMLFEMLAPYGAVWPQWSDGAGVLGPVSERLGMLARKLGRFEEAAGHFEAAFAATTRAGARTLIAGIQYQYALLLRARAASGDTTRAEELLTEALATAQDLGMASLQAKVLALVAPAESVQSAPKVLRTEGAS